MGTKRNFRVQITGLQLNSDGSAALITKQGKDNPSPNGVHVLRAGQVRRLAQRAVGVPNSLALKHLIAMSAGSCFLTGTAEDVKEGEVYEIDNGDGTKGEARYTKDWTKTGNEEIELGAVAVAKMTEISLTAAFSNMDQYAQAPIQRQAAIVHENDEVQPPAGETPVETDPPA